MAATMEEEPVELDSGEPAASGAQHDGTVTGVLTWFKREQALQQALLQTHSTSKGLR